MVRILIADKNPIYRLGLVSILEKEFPSFWITECEDVMTILQSYSNFDLLIINQDHFLLSDSEVQKIEVQTLLISSVPQPLSGVCCQVLKPDCDCNGIINSVKKLLPKTQKKETDLLSDREKEVLKLVATGKTNQEIADILFLSKHTIHTHRKNIFRKLKLSSASELTMYAFKEGILDRKP